MVLKAHIEGKDDKAPLNTDKRLKEKPYFSFETRLGEFQASTGNGHSTFQFRDSTSLKVSLISILSCCKV